MSNISIIHIGKTVYHKDDLKVSFESVDFLETLRVDRYNFKKTSVKFK